MAIPDLTPDLRALRQRLSDAERYLDLEGKRKRLAALEADVGRPDLWDDPDHARAVTTEFGRLGDDVSLVDDLDGRLSDAETLYELAVDEADNSVGAELSSALADLGRRLEELELRSLFSGEHDEGDAVCEIHAGEGGTDAQDWTEMLVRMYLRWAERRGFKAELVEASPGEEAGLKSAALTVSGENAYGTLKAERGVHRLVRLSPFDSAHRRQTSFAQVIVAPLVPDDAKVEIDEAEIRIDTYRASGAGGQHVNKTDSAVRITHLPTGIVVQCQNERSQTSNKQTALRLLRSRLAELAEEEREAELARERGAAQNTGFGSQIRSYVLHPYQLVKDHRTEHEVGNAQGVLDGALDGFIHEYLLAKAAGRVV